MRKVLKWLVIILSSLLGLALVLILVLYAFGTFKLNKTYSIDPAQVNILDDPENIQRGAYIYFHSCVGCHGTNLAGTSVFNDPAIGSIPASNLTGGHGGIGSSYNDIDFVRAIRHGVRPDGSTLIVMPSRSYWYLSDEDLGAIISYIKSAPAVDNDPGKKSIKPLGRILLAVGAFGDAISAEVIDHDDSPPPVPTRGVTAEYGEYLVNTNDCRDCHSPELNGGQSPEPGSPPSPDLTASGSTGRWSKDQFIQAVRTGLTPEGKQIDPDFMPWGEYKNFNDDDLSALYLYLRSLPSSSVAAE